MLGRNPAEFLLISHNNGWISFKELHKALLEEGTFSFLTLNSLKQHFSLFKPREFEVDGEYVRVKQDLLKEPIFSYENKPPPEFLFFPIRQRAYFYIEKHGYERSQNKKWNILCSSREKAILLGKRFTNAPLIIKVYAQRALKAGINFYYARHEIYLVREKIQPEFLELPQVDESFYEKHKPKDETLKEKKIEKEKHISDELNLLSGTFFPSIDAFEKLKRAEKYSRRKGLKKRGKRHRK